MNEIIQQIRNLPRWQQFAIVQGILAELMIDKSESKELQNELIPDHILQNVLAQSQAWRKGELETINREDFFKKMDKMLING